MAAYVKEYSDVLVEELTLREELEREKEIKNNFISTLLAVQSRIREIQASQGKGKKGSSTNSGKVILLKTWIDSINIVWQQYTSVVSLGVWLWG